MKDREKKGGNQPSKRDNDPSRRGDPDRRMDERSGTEPKRKNEPWQEPDRGTNDPQRRGAQDPGRRTDRGGIEGPERRGGQPNEGRELQGDDINRSSEPRRPFDETNIGDEDRDDDLHR